MGNCTSYKRNKFSYGKVLDILPYIEQYYGVKDASNLTKKDFYLVENKYKIKIGISITEGEEQILLDDNFKLNFILEHYDHSSQKSHRERIEEEIVDEHTHCFEFDYFFQKQQSFMISFICRYTDKAFTFKYQLLDIILAAGQMITKKLLINDKEYLLRLQMKTTDCERFNNTLNFEIYARSIYFKMPFVILRTKNTQNEWRKTYKSKPKFGNFIEICTKQFNFHELCGGDTSKKIRIEFCCKLKGFVGAVEASIDELLSSNVFDLKDNFGNQAFSVEIYNKKEVVYPFLDYIKAGLSINLIIGIDFTASNGIPTHQDSHHYISQYHDNLYLKAIKAIGNSVCKYDDDQVFPIYGIGGVPANSKCVSHCFPLSKKAISGIDGIVNAYTKSLNKTLLDGPTLFAPIIYKVTNYVEKELQKVKTVDSPKDQYYILLLLADGNIHDMEETISALFQAVKFPISIIIIGIGNHDFSDMHKLDDDLKKIKNSRGQNLPRDIVQFINFQSNMNEHVLAEEMLRELPGQIESYFVKKQQGQLDYI